jgi:hypothetical protein
LVGYRQQQVRASREIVGQVALPHAGLGGDARLGEGGEPVFPQQLEGGIDDVFPDVHEVRGVETEL